MNLSNKTLGALGMAGAPFLFLEMYTNKQLNTSHEPITGLFDLLYMLGWMCSITALLRMRAAGTKKSGTIILYIQLVFLTLANISNIWVMIGVPENASTFFILDMCWPVSNVWMLVTGILVAVSGRLQGWKRYIVLIVGCWFPVLMLLMTAFGKTDTLFYIGGGYSIVAWSLMGWAIVMHEKKEDQVFTWAI